MYPPLPHSKASSVNHCANCTCIIAPNTGQQFGLIWLDDYCLELLAMRKYLIGRDMTGPGGRVYTLLCIQRNGKLLSYLAPRDFWQQRTTEKVWAWLMSLPDSELIPFRDYKEKKQT